MIDKAIVLAARAYCEDLRAALASPAGASTRDEGVPLPARAREAFARLAARKLERPAPAVGQVWTVVPRQSRGAPALVAMTHVSEALLRGVVLTPEAWVADDQDLVIPGDACPGGEALAACLFLDVPLSVSALAEPVGLLRDDARTGLLMCLQSRLTGGYARAPAGVTSRADVLGASRAWATLLRWTIRAEDGRTVSYLSGPSLNEDDLRLTPRQLLEEATRYLPEQALSAVEALAARPTALEALWERLVGAVKALVVVPDPSRAVASLTPALASLARGLLTANEASALEVPIHLADVVVQLSLERGEAEVLLGAFARDEKTGRPVKGVQVVVMTAERESGRETDEAGVVAGLPLPRQGAFAVEVRRDGVTKRIDV